MPIVADSAYIVADMLPIVDSEVVVAAARHWQIIVWRVGAERASDVARRVFCRRCSTRDVMGASSANEPSANESPFI